MAFSPVRYIEIDGHLDSKLLYFLSPLNILLSSIMQGCGQKFCLRLNLSYQAKFSAQAIKIFQEIIDTVKNNQDRLALFIKFRTTDDHPDGVDEHQNSLFFKQLKSLSERERWYYCADGKADRYNTWYYQKFAIVHSYEELIFSLKNDIALF